MICCTCGHLLVSESSQKFSQWRLDALSIPHPVIKKGRHHGARHGKTDAQKEHFVAHNARKRCIKRNYDGIHHRFQLDPVYRDSQLKIGWTEEKCIAMYLVRNVRNIGKLVYLTEQIWQECTDETPIRLPNRSHNHEPSPPRIWRRTTRTNPFSSIPKVASIFFFQFFMVALG